MKKYGFIILTILAVIAIVAGIITYNNLPTVRLRKQLDLGNKYLNELNYEQAVAEFTKALLIVSDDEEAKEKLALAYLDWGQSYTNEKDYEKAAEIYAEAYIVLPENDEIKKNLVQAYLDWADIFAEAGEYDRAIEIAEKGYDLSENERFIGKIKEYHICSYQYPSDDLAYKLYGFTVYDAWNMDESVLENFLDKYGAEFILDDEILDTKGAVISTDVGEIQIDIGKEMDYAQIRNYKGWSSVGLVYYEYGGQRCGGNLNDNRVTFPAALPRHLIL